MWKLNKKKEKDNHRDGFNHGFETSNRGGEIIDFTYGDVWGRVWRNRARRNGEIYYRVSFDRIYVREDEVRLSKSFSREDLHDLQRCIQRVEIWFLKNV